MMISSALWAHPGVPWSYTWGLILPSHSVWSLSIGEGVMGSSVVTRSCRAPRGWKASHHKGGPQFSEYVSSQQGSSILRDLQKLVGKYLSTPATNKCSGKSFSNCFSCSTQNGTGLGGEGYRVGGQDRVGSPCVNQEILGPTCHILLHPWLQPHDGYLWQAGWLEWATSVLLNHHEERLVLECAFSFFCCPCFQYAGFLVTSPVLGFLCDLLPPWGGLPW